MTVYEKRYTEITRDIQKSILAVHKGENTLISPISIIVLMAIAAEAAGGKTKEEILRYLNEDGSGENPLISIRRLQKSLMNDGSSISSNMVCLKEELKDTLNDDYVKLLRDKYEGEVFSSEDMVSDMNRWVCERTKGVISEIADERMKDMILCLMNAISFEDAWRIPFEDDDIKEKVFRNADGTKVKATMLCGSEHSYMENKDFIGIYRRYKSGEYAYLALLPKDKKKPFDASAMERLNLTEIIQSVVGRRVNYEMPAFSFDYDVDLSSFFQECGIKEAFTSEADFSNLSTAWLTVDEVLHKTHIEVDRHGTKAAAATAMVMEYGAILRPERPKRIVFDRPFLFCICHMETNLPVFVGTLNRLKE